MRKGWKDITSYSAGDKDREVKSAKLLIGSFCLCVTRRHGLDGWFVNCEPFWDYRSLKSAGSWRRSAGSRDHAPRQDRANAGHVGAPYVPNLGGRSRRFRPPLTHRR